MGLLSFLQRPTDASTAPDPRSVEDIRRRARRRLIGAAALVVVAVVAFPLLFDAAPRPVAVDIAIEIPSRDAVAPLTASRAAPTPASASAVPSGAAVQPPPQVDAPASQASARQATPETAPILTETAAEAGREVAPVEKLTNPTARERSAAALEAARALAALESRPIPTTEPSASAPVAARPPESASRFVVQVGAFSEPGPLRETRQKVEKLGLKTYTQVVETAAGPRTRVRVGPFGDRGEADRAAAQIRQSGLAPVVLSL